MIAYSPDAEPARAHLLKSANTIDVFVEDSAAQNFYVVLINRMLGKAGRISQVYPLSGRANVLEQCQADQAYRPRKRLYVIDADHDLLLGRGVPKMKHLFRLSAYCSENLVLSEHAFISIAAECAPSVTWPDLALQLKLRTMLDGAVELLLPLFVVYAAIHELGLGIETVSYSVHRLLSVPGDPATLSRSLIDARILSLVRKIRASVAGTRYRKLRDRILRRMATGDPDLSRYISGKTYLLPLVHLQLRRVAGFNEAIDKLKVRAGHRCELDIDQSFTRAVRRAAR
jgi:hypothetical protein